jgi:NAD(P)H-nitrite reductase large subunit
VQQGKAAGSNMAGCARHYDGSLGMNSINFPGVDLISFGVTRPAEDSDYEVLTDDCAGRGVYKKIVLRENQVKGLILVNKIDAAGVLLSLLRSRTDVAPFKSELLSDRFSYAQLLALGGPREWNRYRTASSPTENG